MGLKKYAVYMHTNTVNGKKYIGITSQNPLRRWRNGEGYRENEHFFRAIRKYGWDNFTHEIIKSDISKEDACALEKALIREYKSNFEEYGYNKSEGGENPNQGVKASEETRAKMSKAHKGRIVSAETRERLSKAKKGKSNGHEGQRGAECPKAGLLMQISLEDGEVVAIYHGFCEMARETGFAMSPVKRATHGKQHKSYGYKWEYIKGDKNVII